MRKTVAIVAIIAMALFSVACEPTIDMDNEDSLDTVYASAEDQDELLEAFTAITLNYMNDEDEMEDILDGKTAQEVIDWYEDGDYEAGGPIFEGMVEEMRSELE